MYTSICQGMSSSLLWMEYRRGLTPSWYLRLFWIAKWGSATYFLVINKVRGFIRFSALIFSI